MVADHTFRFSTAGASATACETDDGFVVLAGSTARRAHSGTFPACYLVLRDQLLTRPIHQERALRRGQA